MHEDDIAKVAVEALLDDRHVGCRYVVTGPESLSERERATILADVLGKPVDVLEVDPAASRAAMLVEGIDPALAEAAIAAWERLVSVPEPVTDAVLQVSGSPPRSFRDWAAEHANAFD